MAPIFSKPCLVCRDQGEPKSFPTTASAIVHVMEFHHVNQPEDVQVFVDTDLSTIATVVNQKIGNKGFDYTIHLPSNRPICNGCPQRSFPTWHHAVSHCMAHHQIFNPWVICQMVGKDVMSSIPEIRQSFKYVCFHCPQPRFYQLEIVLNGHLKNHHGLSQVDAYTFANIQRNLSLFDEIKKEVIEENN